MYLKHMSKKKNKKKTNKQTPMLCPKVVCLDIENSCNSFSISFCCINGRKKDHFSMIERCKRLDMI